jgi:protein-tyrosine-phosphatase
MRDRLCAGCSDSPAQAGVMTCNVLFLCTGNSARSILAEALLNHMGAGKFRAYSAGSHPTGKVNPYALQLLERMRISTEGARSKSWDEFTQPGAPHLDFVFTVCGNAAGETCPVWSGQPITAHWGVEDPAAVEGDDLARTNAFRQAFHVLEHRIRFFAALPVASLDKVRLKAHVIEIGRSMPDA